MLTLCCVVLLAQALPPNPEAIPPSVDRRMILTMPKLTPPMRSEQYRAAEHTARALQKQLLDPMMRNGVPTTRLERELIHAMAMAATPEAFLFNGPEWKILQNATHRVQARVSRRVLEAIDYYPYRTSKAPPPTVEVFRGGVRRAVK